MDIKDVNTLTRAIEQIAPFCVDWALSDRADDLIRMAEARRRQFMYKEFEIPKRSGGTRRITAPTGRLKYKGTVRRRKFCTNFNYKNEVVWFRL